MARQAQRLSTVSTTTPITPATRQRRYMINERRTTGAAAAGSPLTNSVSFIKQYDATEWEVPRETVPKVDASILHRIAFPAHGLEPTVILRQSTCRSM